MMPETIDMHEVIDIIVTTLDARDPYTYEHSFRVAQYSEIISERMGLPSDVHQRIHIAAHLHDIGKIGVSDVVLNKPGTLTTEEMMEIQTHSRIGYNILTRIPVFTEIAEIVLCHHERFDGRGYPRGITGNAIPLESRIIAVADSFDAITSDRPYRSGKTFAEASVEISAHAGDQFDPVIVELFLDVCKSIPQPAASSTNTERHYAYIGHEDLMHSRKIGGCA